ncbi:hypothetical protein ABZS71_32555 [Streptomyces sp. NPDC005393]|uniref:hypothetical protein n=1 Tax=Streptomyces sp. NPDC005393 TaxID=3157041 RepID=UPI0033B3C649
MPPTVLQRLGEQLAPLVSVLGAGGAHVVQYGHGLAQPVHRRADIDEVGSGQCGSSAQRGEFAVLHALRTRGAGGVH